jgi:hypothetical protein
MTSLTAALLVRTIIAVLFSIAVVKLWNAPLKQGGGGGGGLINLSLGTSFKVVEYT